MTIRQLSEAAGCHIDTVRKLARPMFPSVKAESRGMAIDYNEDQSIKIMERLPKRNMVDSNPLKNQVAPLEKSSIDSLLTEKDLALISSLTAGIVSKVFENLDNRMNKIESRYEERKALLPPPEMEPRQQLKKIVNFYCGRTHSDYRTSWNDLYREFNYLYHCNVQLNAKNRGIRGVDYVDTVMEKLPELISLAIKLFGQEQMI